VKESVKKLVINGQEAYEYALHCPDCGAMMSLRASKFGLFYGCSMFPQCRATHGAHPWGAPLGIPAKRDTKMARIRAHAAFDRLWKEGRMRPTSGCRRSSG
jgi:ssDNA-binding Zn-finger/Zn-ribbon topoisomerase 1